MKTDGKILQDIKTMLGVPEEDISFDNELLLHLNSEKLSLAQYGTINNAVPIKQDTTWSEIVDTDSLVDLSAVADSLFIRIKLVFDPPSNSFVTESYNSTLNEIDWRLNLETGILGGEYDVCN